MILIISFVYEGSSKGKMDKNPTCKIISLFGLARVTLRAVPSPQEGGESMTDPLDAGPQYAWWVPDQALRDLQMEKALHSDESNATLTKRLINENLPMAAMSVIHMALHSSDERIRLAAAKFLIDSEIQVSGKDGKLSDGDFAWNKVYAVTAFEAPRQKE